MKKLKFSINLFFFPAFIGRFVLKICLFLLIKTLKYLWQHGEYFFSTPLKIWKTENYNILKQNKLTIKRINKIGSI